MSFDRYLAATLSVQALTVEHETRTQEFAITDHADAALIEKFLLERRLDKADSIIRIEDVHAGLIRSFTVPFGVFVQVSYKKLDARQEAYVNENAATATKDGLLAVSSWDSTLSVTGPGTTIDMSAWDVPSDATPWNNEKPPF